MLSRKLKLLTLFSGLGSPERALKNINIDYDLIGFSEIYEPAIKSYCLLHNEDRNKNLGNINNIDFSKIQDFDMVVWGFPCVDLSICSLRKGLEEGKKSSLYFKGLDLLKVKRPYISIIENVSNLVSKQFQHTYNRVLNDLSDLGYSNYTFLMNAKDFGIPQIRERIFIVSVLDFHKDIKEPKKQPLLFKFSDIATEKDVSRFSLTECAYKRLTRGNRYNKGCYKIEDVDYVRTLVTRSVGRETTVINDVANGVIRELTSRERMLLSGYTEMDYDLMYKNGITKSAFSRLAGNTIVVNVLEALFKSIFESEVF